MSVFSTVLYFFPNKKVQGRPLQGAGTCVTAQLGGGAAEAGAALPGGGD